MASSDGTQSAPEQCVSPQSGRSPDEKQDLELAKLRLEIASLRRKWWQSPALGSAILVGLISLGVSWYAGLFDLARKQIEFETNRSKFEKDRAEVELAKVQAERDQTKADIREQTRIRDEIKVESRRLNEKKDAASIALARIQNELVKGRREVGEARAALDRAIESERAALARTKATEALLHDLARPALRVVRTELDDEKVFDFRLGNRGPGPAVLKRNQYFVDGRPLRPNATLLELLDALEINETFMGWTEYDPGERLPMGAEMKFLRVREHQFSQAAAYEFSRAAKRLAIAVCSCSIDGTCGWATYGQVPGELGACE